MSSGLDMFRMVSGIGDAFDKSYAEGVKQRQEREAPGLIADLMNSYGGGSAAPAPGAVPGPAAPAITPTGGSSLPFFARAQGALPSEKLRGLISDVATRNDIDPGYLTKLVSIESRGDPNARNKSGAAGLLQFMPKTAEAYGLADPFDPIASLNAGARLTLDYKASLAQALGRAPTNGELYLGHQQGATGAARLLANPDVPAARLVGVKAVVANGGTPNMSARDFAGLWTSRFDGDAPQVAQVAQARPSAVAAAPAPAAAPSPTAVPTFPALAMTGGGRTMVMPGTSPVPAAQAATAEADDEADKPAVGARPAAFQIPAGGAATAQPQPAPVAAPAQAPAAQGFAGFGSPANRLSPQQQAALTAAWKNPETRPMATAIYGQLLKGQESAWKLNTMGDQPVLFNERTAQIIPVGQAKRSTATVGNVVIDTATGQPIYRGEQDPKTATVGNTIVDLRTGQPLYQGQDKPQVVAGGSSLMGPDGRIIGTAPKDEKDDKYTYQSMPGVGMVALHPTDPGKSRVIIAGQQPRAMTPEESALYSKGYMGADGAPHIPSAAVQVLPGEKESEKEIGKAVGGEVAEAIKSGRPALEKLNAIGIMRDAFNAGANNITTGPMAESVLALKQFAKGSLGMSVDGLSNSEVIQKIGTQLATANAKSLTSRPTQFDFATYLKNNPGLLLSPEGNKAMLDILQQQAQREYDLSRLATKKENQADFGATVDAYDKAHPIVSPFTGKPLGTGDVDAPGAPGAAKGAPTIAKGTDRVALPNGYTAARALSEAKAAVAGGKDKGAIAERLARWGIDPARLDQ